MTSEKVAQYGRLLPMLAALEALVRCESPSDDLAACRAVVALASEIAERVLGSEEKKQLVSEHHKYKPNAKHN